MLGILVMAVPKWTMAQITPVCDRTPGVRDAIVKLVPGKNDCADVNEADLAGIEGVLRLVGPHEVTFQDPYQAPYIGGDLSEPLMELKAGDFSGLSSLEAITLRYNHLTSLPANVFSGLPSLQWLNLSHNDLITLPAGLFSGLRGLQRLYLNDNALTTLPVGVFSGLTGLQELYLSDNSLSGLEREVFAGLSALRRLHLRYNDLTGLPSGVFSGKSALQVLYLSYNELETLPVGAFSGLPALQRLSLTSNNLIALPEEIFFELPSLQWLSLARNDLTTLPTGVFGGLAALKELSLSKNALTGLPVEVFSELPSLQWLSLSDNDLARLPPGIFSELASLVRLDLSDCGLTDLSPGVFAGLTALEWLNLSRTGMTTLPVGGFMGLNALQELYLIGGDLTTLPAGAFSGLPSLERLDLSYNALTNLAKGVFLGLSALTWLDLEFNRLTRLTDGLFSGLKSLYIVQLHGNPGPLPIVISLELVDEGRFRVRVHAGATFAIVLPATVNNGSIEEDRARAGDLQFLRSQPTRTAIIIPTGRVTSPVFKVSRTPGTLAAVTVDLGRLPRPPKPEDWYPSGYYLLKDAGVPLTVLETLSLDFPHFGNGESISSDVVLVNIGSRPIRPVIHFSDQKGDPIRANSVVDVMRDFVMQTDGALRVRRELAPLGELTITTHGRGPLVNGSVRVVSNGPIGGVLRFDAPGIGVAGVGASRPLRDALFPARRQVGGIRTAMAIHNLSEEAAEVTCRLMKGGAILETAAFRLEANGQVARFLEEVFAETGTSEFVGSVRCAVPEENQFTGVAIEMDPDNRIFTTVPVMPFPSVRRLDTTILNFAHFANGESITSEIVLANMSIYPIRPALYFYDREGKSIDPESVVEVTGDLKLRQRFPGDPALTVETAMKPLGELTISTHGLGEVSTGSVRVLADVVIGGALRFDIQGVGVAGVEPGRPVRDAIFPVRYQKGGIRTGVAIRNLEEKELGVTCQLMRKGAVLAETEILLNGQGQTARFVDEIFPQMDSSDFGGSVRCTVSGQGRFTGVALEMDIGSQIFTTLPVVPVWQQ